MFGLGLKNPNPILEVDCYSFLKVGITHALGVSALELERRIQQFLPDQVIILDSNYRL